MPVLLRTKTAGESLGELALMYDAKRNVTVRCTSNALLWAVNRAEFKSILQRHLTGSPIAQVSFILSIPGFHIRIKNQELILVKRADVSGCSMVTLSSALTSTNIVAP
jgi:CRP-like cAMP-binding protein